MADPAPQVIPPTAVPLPASVEPSTAAATPETAPAPTLSEAEKEKEKEEKGKEEKEKEEKGKEEKEKEEKGKEEKEKEEEEKEEKEKEEKEMEEKEKEEREKEEKEKEEREKEKQMKEKESVDSKDKDAKEKEAPEKLSKDAATPVISAPEATAGITRTFTTHAGETVTVAELPSAKHEDVPATVPEADHDAVKDREHHVEKIVPVIDHTPPTKSIAPVATKAVVPAMIPKAGHIVIKTQDHAGKSVPISVPIASTPVPQTATPAAGKVRTRMDNDLAASTDSVSSALEAKRKRSLTASEPASSLGKANPPLSTAPKARSLGIATINSSQSLDPTDSPIPLSGIDRDIGVFPQYFAGMETTLDVQTIFRTDGLTSQAFTDGRGTPMLTLDCKPSLLEDRELRDKSRMFLLGIHRRRFRRPKQWHVKTGSDHGIRVKSSWKRNRNLTLSFKNQPDGQAMKMLLVGRKLHLNSDVLSPVVAVIEPSRLRVAKGLDLTIACVASVIRSEMQEVNSGGSLKSSKGSFIERWRKFESRPSPPLEGFRL